jgi:Fe2+ or Zn2+ uptake regulation protein
MPYVEVPQGTVVEAKQFVVYGICAECAASEATERERG